MRRRNHMRGGAAACRPLSLRHLASMHTNPDSPTPRRRPHQPPPRVNLGGETRCIGYYPNPKLWVPKITGNEFSGLKLNSIFYYSNYPTRIIRVTRTPRASYDLAKTSHIQHSVLSSSSLLLFGLTNIQRIRTRSV
jgi:hypothetical protein